MMRKERLPSPSIPATKVSIDNINRKSLERGGVAIDTLVAGIEGEGKRSFRIIRAKPDGKSYAHDIAESYGLTYEKIIKRVDD